MGKHKRRRKPARKRRNWMQIVLILAGILVSTIGWLRLL